ncbi:MAG: nucleotide exchange factor GrpE [Deltaproteobacteria bacterium]|nr:nucleotide exchange factor GrpE [Deltaproteobacteria bacterium]MCB9479051.1 nucleotide exchange factor GrpE [Deltaproteobacteria bacterium]MCB9488113.1 nucleotide exchange factor GrpE [Deltaproteobacteria bacterium]
MTASQKKSHGAAEDDEAPVLVDPEPEGHDVVDEINEAEAHHESEAPTQTPEERERELLDHIQRLAAEFDNYRKKNANEFSRGRERGLAEAVEALLPALDSMDLAEQAMVAGGDGAALRQGFEAVLKQLNACLGGLGLERVDARTGEELDPNVHEVLMAEPNDEVEPGKILGVYQKGYRLNGRLLRAAKVRVAKQP